MAADPAGLIADPFQVIDRFTYRDNQAQISSSGLATGDDQRTLLIDHQLHIVNRVITLTGLFGQVCIAFHKCLNCIAELTLNHAAHSHQFGTDLFQLFIEALGYMSAVVVLFVSHFNCSLAYP